MRTIFLRPLYLAALLAAAPAFAAETPTNIAAVLQPFVDRHTLADLVTGPHREAMANILLGTTQR